MALRWRGALLLTFLLAAGMGYYYSSVVLPYAASIRTAHQADAGYSFGTDFYPIWLTSRECLPQRRDPYTSEVTREIQTGLFGRAFGPLHSDDPSPDYRAFSYPAFVDFFGAWLAWLPFPVARIILAILLPVCVVASVRLWSRTMAWRASPIVLIIFTVFALSSYPGLEALYAQQFGLIVALLLSAGAAALVANRLGLAGCLLALATAKPQMSALLILYLLLWALANWKEHWRFAASFTATLTALIFSAWLVWPHWIAGWLQVLRNYRNYSRPPLLGYLFGHSTGVLLIGLALAGSVGLAWRTRRVLSASPQFALTVGLLLAVTTVTLLPEHAVYDHVVLLPGIMLILRFWDELWARGNVVRCMLALAAGALFWPWLAAILVIAARITSFSLGPALLFLPLRTAAAIPLVVLAVLFVAGRIRRRAVDEPVFVAGTTGL